MHFLLHVFGGRVRKGRSDKDFFWDGGEGGEEVDMGGFGSGCVEGAGELGYFGFICKILLKL